MRFLAVVLCLIALAAPSPAMQRSPRSKESQRTDAALLAIRQDALSTVDQVIDEIGGVDDLRSRVALAEKIVRLLAQARPDRCRKMLNSIFDEAVALRTNPKETPIPPDLDSIISRTIQAAAVIDLELAHRFIEALSNSKQTDPKAKQDASTAGTLYLRVATDLIGENPPLAVSIASRSLAFGITPETLTFLALLRKRDAGLANRLLLSATQSCKDGGAKDVNELLLLHSYVFLRPNPPVVLSRGLGSLNIPGFSELTKDQSVDGTLAAQYLKIVSEILLDPHRYAAGKLRILVRGAEGDFFLLTVVEPTARNYLPTVASAISSQRNVLLNYLEADRREAAFSTAERWNETPKDVSPISGANTSSLEYLVKKAESASDSKRRDQLYFRAALAAVEIKEYETAFNLIEKISVDADKAKHFLRFDIALHHLRNRRPFEAEKLARLDEVLERRAYILTLIADYLVAEQIKESSRAIQYLEEAQRIASFLPNDQEKMAVLIGAGSVYARFDMVRASEVLRDAIKLSNKLPDFAGESTITYVLEVGGFFFDYSLYDNGFTIFDIVERLAQTSYYGTLQEVRTIKNRLFRLRAIIALCIAVGAGKPLTSALD